MKHFLLITTLVMVSSCFTGCDDPPPPPGGVRVQNVNGFVDDALVRVWILTESQIANAPTTKAEAADLESFVIPPLRRFTFNRDPGNYFVVASNETWFQGLADDATFEPNSDFSLQAVAVEDQLVSFAVRNTSTPTLLPEFIEQ